MTNDMNKIADKIQKLLSLAGNNPSQEEAQKALLKAQELMAKYNLEQGDISGEEIKYTLETAAVKVNPRSKSICLIIAESFACKVILQWQGKSQKIVFFGREDNAKAAKSAMDYIHRVMERGMTKACRDHGYESTSVAGASMVYNSYASGFISGLKSAMSAQTTALAVVVPQDVKDEFNKAFPSVKKGRASHMTSGDYKDSYRQGMEDGRKVMDKRSIEPGKEC